MPADSHIRCSGSMLLDIDIAEIDIAAFKMHWFEIWPLRDYNLPLFHFK